MERLFKSKAIGASRRPADRQDTFSSNSAPRNTTALFTAIWKSEHHASEIDFLIEQPSSILPLEVKAGVNPKSKSLRSFADKYKPRMLLRSSLFNLMRNGDILNIPLYAINVLEKLLTK